jgi:PhnB protein
MTISAITPYFFFNGEAEDALGVYEKALGAKTDQVMRWGSQPEMCPKGAEDRIMHAALDIGNARVMLADSPTTPDVPKERAPSVAIAFEKIAEQEKAFNALAEHGTVVDPLADQFWGDRFGVIRDKFGITWMFTCPLS